MHSILCDAKPGQVIDAVVDDDGELRKVRIEIKHVFEKKEHWTTKFNAYGHPTKYMIWSYFSIRCNTFHKFFDTIDVEIHPKKILRFRNNFATTPNHGIVVDLYLFDEEKMAAFFDDSVTGLVDELQRLQTKRRELVAEVDLAIDEVNKQLKTKQKERRTLFLEMMGVKQ